MLEIILLHFLKIEEKPTPSATVNNEGLESCIESQVDTGKALDIAEYIRKSAEKQGMGTPPKDINSEIKRNNLEQEWDQFNKKVQDTPKKTDAWETMEYQTPLHVQRNTESEPIDEKAMMS